jgi:poly-gamma-glutamate capsule biosynthesis protein CapA/YwtB (metallophosphatase superfamily)
VQRLAVVTGGGILLGVVAFLLTGGSALLLAAPDTTLARRPPTSFVAPAQTGAAPDSTAAPTTSAPSTTSPPRAPLVIHGTGDVNTDISYIPALAEEGHGYAWDGVRELFLSDDLTVVNLECTPSPKGEPLDKAFVFRCDQDSLPTMAEAGVDVVNLANNHSRDHGAGALLDGIDRTASAGLLPVGVGRDAAAANRPVLVEVNGWTVAVLGFGGVVPTPDWVASEGQPGMADGDTVESMVEAVAAAEELADLVVVSVHWGVERDLAPREEDRARAEAMVEAGADVIFGHHAHRLQPMEQVDGAQVAWGLGNFVWPTLSEESSRTAVARVVVEPDGTIDGCLIPATITRPGRPRLDGDAPC